MNNNNLLLFDKNGHLMNSLTDGEKNTYRKIIDPSELGTYNSTSLHLFEKIEPTAFNANITTNVVQYVNDYKMDFYDGNKVCDITNIEKTNSSSQFKTKWIYGPNIDKIAPIGSNVVLVGLPSPFNEITTSKTNYYVVLKTKNNGILIEIGSTNNVALPSFTFNTSTYIRTLSCLKLRPVIGSGNTQYNIQDANSLYVNRKFSVINSKYNNGEYSLKELVNTKTIKRNIIILTNSFTTFRINYTNLLDRIKLYSDTLSIYSNGTIVFPGSIPGNLKVGDEFYLEGNTLHSTNTQFMTVTSIKPRTKSITFSYTTTPVEQLDMLVTLGLTKNTLSFDFSPKTTYDNSTFSPSVTAAYIASELNKNLDDSIICSSSNNILYIDGVYEGTYFNIEAFKDSISYTVSTPVNNTKLFVFDNLVNENCDILKIKPIESVLVTKSEQLLLEINGHRFIGEDATTINEIIDNFYNNNIINLSHNFNITIDLTLSNILKLYYDDFTPNEIPSIKIISNNAAYYRTNIIINNINNLLTITINNTEYSQSFNTNVNTTISDWVSSYSNILELNNIFLFTYSNNIYFYTTNRYSQFDVAVNVGVAVRPGDNLFTIINVDDYTIPIILNSYELYTNDINPLLKNINVGQVISVSGINNIGNKKYYINNLTSNRIGLSYQGDFLQLTNNNITIAADMHLRYPITDDENENLIVTINNGFFVDLTGEQAIKQQQLPYTGPLPISDYLDKFILVTEENTNLNYVYNPFYQKNVYDKLLITLPTALNDITQPSNPINLHIGIFPETEEYINTEINIYRNRSVGLTINSNTSNDNLVTFSDNKIIISNFDGSLELLKIGDKYKISYNDLSGFNNIILNNNDVEFTITNIVGNTIFTDTTFVSEASVKSIPKTTYPYTDEFNNPLTENRAVQIIFTYVPQILKTINLLSEVNSEDTRFDVRLRNIGRNITVNDLNILKNYNNDEYNIKWSVLNQKRKEMIEIHPDIFDIPSTYLALDNALKFWGYRDLKLFEYFINNNIDSPNYGNLKPVEKSGFSSTYIWPNDNKTNNFIKTNKISLGYRITDLDGNYIESIDLKTLQSKLFKLNQWLSDNVLATAQLTDISGMSVGRSQLYLTKQSGISTGLTSTVRSSLLDFNITGYNNGISTLPTSYNIVVSPIANDLINEYTVTYNTFKVDTYDYNTLFLQDSIVKYNNAFWKANYNNINSYPILNDPTWSKVNLPYFNYIQSNTVIANNFSDISFQMDSNIENMIAIKTTAFVDGKIAILTKIIELNSGIWPA